MLFTQFKSIKAKFKKMTPKISVSRIFTERKQDFYHQIKHFKKITTC